MSYLRGESFTANRDPARPRSRGDPSPRIEIRQGRIHGSSFFRRKRKRSSQKRSAPTCFRGACKRRSLYFRFLTYLFGMRPFRSQIGKAVADVFSGAADADPKVKKRSTAFHQSGRRTVFPAPSVTVLWQTRPIWHCTLVRAVWEMPSRASASAATLR